ncbi:hypothetical protein A6J69_012530 [Hafnia paralvei]|nr:hypothetical protein A6J69_012530 [Hafnia paralvei]
MVRLNERLTKLEANRPKKNTKAIEVSPEMMVSALVMMYDDDRPHGEIAAMVASGCYVPPVRQLHHAESSDDSCQERYKQLCH